MNEKIQIFKGITFKVEDNGFRMVAINNEEINNLKNAYNTTTSNNDKKKIAGEIFGLLSEIENEFKEKV